MNKYVFKKYDPEFLEFFQEEENKLMNLIDSDVIIEHIGSTSIPNLGGKGILDIAIGIIKGDLTNTKSILENVGYIFREKASYPERLFFRIDYPDGESSRRVHIHLTKFNSKDWNEMTKFRDYLLKHPKEILIYEEIKKQAVEIAQGDGEIYRKIKEEYIKNVLGKI